MKTIGVLGGLGPQATKDFEARPHQVAHRLILMAYGIDNELTAEELEELSDAMYTLAEQPEFRVAGQRTSLGFRGESKHAPIWGALLLT